jgi:phosphoribosylaminoimidazole carboxylase PurE protein
MDSLLATLQMPSGIPVATVTLGSAGPVNAAILAVQILATDRPQVRKKLARHKKSLEKKVNSGNARVQAALTT